MRMTVCCPNQPNSSAYCSAHQKDSYNVFNFRLSGVWGERMWGSCLIWTLQEISPSAHKLLEPSHPRLNILLIFLEQSLRSQSGIFQRLNDKRQHEQMVTNATMPCHNIWQKITQHVQDSKGQLNEADEGSRRRR